VLLIQRLAEARIEEAIKEGVFDNLPGAGRPLALDGDRHVPESLRVAYRVLKNSGFLPPELELRREIADAGELLRLAESPMERTRAARRLEALKLRLAHLRGRSLPHGLAGYQEALLSRLDQAPAAPASGSATSAPSPGDIPSSSAT
jgi:hypothetical protein